MALNRFYLTENSIAQRSGLCIFISHQKRDADTAKKIADYLITSGIDVYFDEYDTTSRVISLLIHVEAILQKWLILEGKKGTC